MSIDGGLRQLFRERVPSPADWQAVETGGTGRGVPDSNVCIEGRERWLEYKVTAGWAVPLRPEQVGWLLRRERHGGVTFVCVRRVCEPGRRRLAADELWMFRGNVADLLRAGGLGAAEPLACFPGGPSSWDWAAVRRIVVAGGLS